MTASICVSSASTPSPTGLPEEVRLMIWKLVVPSRMSSCARTIWTDAYRVPRVWHQWHTEDRPWKHALLSLMLINKQTKQDIDGSVSKIQPTLVFCNHHHARRFFFPSIGSVMPRSDVGVPDVYVTHTIHRFNGVLQVESDSVEEQKTLLHRAIKSMLESGYGLHNVPESDLETTFLLEYERRLSAEHDPDCRNALESDLQELSLGTWRSEKKYETKHIHCTKIFKCVATGRVLSRVSSARV
ncbi:uncharacterized protein AB675_12054 [Cyphellophora attinorum]|uniref:Uncharacterized protein n=1 Tax=Cyphellophora attinorum TaxID=1664694 RepID=A0A0N1HRE8_9EURO|nr:uncharacterized protein AB675_12054 [Phialophora attinorum]KPI38345.1 hypothetical protein AB675_12054 [Phialophora attinorum]